ncbi:MAG: oligopeptide/dipeptide ABC transporter ATP-binding protein [Pseudomonadota bacterium]
MSQAAQTELVRAEGLCKHYRVGVGFMGAERRTLQAVDQVDLTIHSGEVLGLVGESGCGKSTLGRLILRLTEPSAGRVSFAGRDITGLGRSELRHLRRQMQIVFQDPMTSLNPRLTVGSILAEPLRIHGLGNGPAIRARVAELMHQVGLRPDQAGRYPHQFSGGQRQRIGIARALALNPRLVVADEPVSALDVSIQAQVMNLLLDLKEKFGLTYLLVAHDLSVVRHLSDRIAVMYLGRVMEVAPAAIFDRPPLHPYSEALLASAPVADPGRKARPPALKGDVASPLEPPPGCRFHTRCPEMQPRCQAETPALREIAPGHLCACHYR